VFSGSGRATRRIACACALTLLGWAAAPARAEPPALLVISTGQYGMRREIPHALGIGLEIRAPWQWTVIRPSFGLLTTARGGAYLYSGIVADIPLPLDLALVPGFAPGVVVAKGQGDLGSPIEFRSSLELAWAPATTLRLGVSISHISNARLGSSNPGVETLMFTVAFPGRP
jgi:lipid A 3-O-deacylase